MHILRRVIAGLGALHRVLAGLGALHPRPRRPQHGGGATDRSAMASNAHRLGSDVSAPGEGRQAVTIRVATFNAALFSMAPAVQATAIPGPGAGTGAESGTGVRPRPKGILKAQASPVHRTTGKARVTIDLQDDEISLGSHGERRQPQVAGATRRSVEEVLRETGADIIGLQNVRAEEERGMRPLSELAAALGMWYVFAESWAPGYGNAVLSRWPIKRCKALGIADHSDFRDVLRATIDVPGQGEVSFHCTHLDNLDESLRMKQVDSMLRSDDGPHILAGGLNALDGTDYSAERWANIVKYYEEIGKPMPKVEVMEYLKGKHFVDAKYFAGELENVVVVAKGQDVQATCKYGTRVDYILASPNFPHKFVPGSYMVVSSKGTSDHHIVMVDVMISPASFDSTDSVVLTATGATPAPLAQSAETTRAPATGAPKVAPPPEETPATNEVELVTTNVDQDTHQSTPTADEELASAGTSAAQEATSMAPRSSSTANPEKIIETTMLEVSTDSDVLQANTLEGDITTSVPNAICKEIAPYINDKEKGVDTVATTSTTASDQPLSFSSFELLGKLRGEEADRRKSIDELLHRIEQSQKHELDATQLETSQLKEKLELEQRNSEREITSAKLKALKEQEAAVELSLSV